ncbi:GntR family transcriptional regulator [Kribbella albertanoniae]|uniref:GntR family transcriptional regulator n=1 Tax=Kribbella albertanoniae TaxID=1266829 RepID=A0A4R4PS66_9ACTN|nr:GntR family transcriptional regulator [Kribbella albertanoniae]TDC24993.1 GntR family transcriptional regulator [Kribbella albertanoniae]
MQSHVDARFLRDIVELWALEEGAAARLPGEETLMQLFGTNRSTVREALALLAQSGRVDRRRGVGTAWAPTAPVVDIGLDASTSAVGLVSEVLKWFVLDGPPPLTTILPVDEGEACLIVEVRNWSHGTVAAVGTFYVRSPEHEHLSRDTFTNDLPATLRAAGVVLSTARTTLRAVLADDADRVLLQVPAGTPLLRSDSLVSDATGRPVFFAQARSADAYRYQTP